MRKSLRSKEEVARSESRAQPARSRVLLSLSARRGYIFYESPEVSSRGRDEEVEKITSRRGGIKCKKQEEREEEEERKRENDHGRRWRSVEKDGDEANRQADGFERTGRERERGPRRGSRR